MVDLTFLEKFTKGNTAKMKRYISMYLNIAPETFERMQQNVVEQNWADLAINAHSLKPQTDYMGIASLKEVLISIENKATEGNPNELKALLNNALHLHEQSLIHLKSYVDKL